MILSKQTDKTIQYVKDAKKGLKQANTILGDTSCYKEIMKKFKCY